MIQIDQWSKLTQEYQNKLNVKNLSGFSGMHKGLKIQNFPLSYRL